MIFIIFSYVAFYFHERMIFYSGIHCPLLQPTPSSADLCELGGGAAFLWLVEHAS